MNRADARAAMMRLSSLTGGSHLFEQAPFRRLWFARLISHAAGNAVMYSLLVLVVKESHSSVQASVLVISYILPTATLGTISGVIADRLPKGFTLFVANAARMGIALFLMGSFDVIGALYGTALLMAVASQFSGPADSAALPLVVPDSNELARANSIFNLQSVLSQVMGMVVLAPLFLKTFGPAPLFFICAAMFGAAAVMYALVPNLGFTRFRQVRDLTIRGARQQFARAWHTLSQDGTAYMAVIISVLASATALVLVTLVPRYTRDVLGVGEENAVFVLAPSVGGILAGLRLTPWVLRRVGTAAAVTAAFVGLVGGLGALSLVEPLGDAVAGWNLLGLWDPGPFGQGAARVLVTMVFATTMAFAYTVIGVTGRNVVNERIPLEMQGRVFAAQVVLTNLASIPPIILTSGLADLLGVPPVLLLVALVILLAAGWLALANAARRAAAAPLT